MNTSQKIISSEGCYSLLDDYLYGLRCKSLFLVCDSSIQYFLELYNHLIELERKGLEIVRFSNFKPNPEYESVVAGVEELKHHECDTIMAVGGGSAMDVAKCIKIFCNMDMHENFLKQTIVPNDMPFIAMPTTAGTGSEATRYAVIYYEGSKQSITSESCIPEAVFFDPSVLKTLPAYQRKSTMMDAFCHSIESFWSVHSNTESKMFCRNALSLILDNLNGYLANNEYANANMLLAAHFAGQAINITQTTAGHAMCYKITSLYGCAHGHAAALCNRRLFPWMIGHLDECIDPRGKEYLQDTIRQLAEALKCTSTYTACKKINDLFIKLQLSVPQPTESEYSLLSASVNLERLKNHPIKLDKESINQLYHEIFIN